MKDNAQSHLSSFGSSCRFQLLPGTSWKTIWQCSEVGWFQKIEIWLLWLSSLPLSTSTELEVLLLLMLLSWHQFRQEKKPYDMFIDEPAMRNTSNPKFRSMLTLWGIPLSGLSTIFASCWVFCVVRWQASIILFLQWHCWCSSKFIFLSIQRSVDNIEY